MDVGAEGFADMAAVCHAQYRAASAVSSKKQLDCCAGAPDRNVLVIELLLLEAYAPVGQILFLPGGPS